MCVHPIGSIYLENSNKWVGNFTKTTSPINHRKRNPTNVRFQCPCVTNHHPWNTIKAQLSFWLWLCTKTFPVPLDEITVLDKFYNSSSHSWKQKVLWTIVSLWILVQTPKLLWHLITAGVGCGWLFTVGEGGMLLSFGPPVFPPLLPGGSFPFFQAQIGQKTPGDKGTSE